MLLVGLMAMGASMKVFASARLDGMGSNLFVNEDLDSVFLYPNKAYDYSNIINIRGLIPAGGTVWGGLIMKDDAIGAMGIYANYTGVEQASQNPLGTTPATAPNNRMNLLWANNFSGLTLGVGVDYSDTGYNGLVAAGDSGNNYGRDIAIKLGMGVTADTFSQINFHLGYEMASAYAGGTSASNAPSVISAGALAQKDLDANNDLRMFADLALLSNPAFIANQSDSNVVVGLAANRKVNDGKGLVSTGLMIDYVGTEGSADNYILAWTGNVESKVADWLTLRTGISKQLYNALNTTAFNFNTGASINWQNFTLDVVVSPTSLENSIANVQPGNGIFYGNEVVGGSNNNGGAIVTVSEADLSYKF